MEGGGALVAARFVFLTASMVAFGSALFRFYAFRRGDEGETAGHIRALVRGAAFCALLSACGWLGLTAVDFGGDDLASFASTLWTILFATDFGPVWLVRLAAALALLVVAVLRPRPVVVLALATVVLGSEAWIGHSAIGGPLHRAVQVVHLLSAGAVARRPGCRSPMCSERARRGTPRRIALAASLSASRPWAWSASA